MIYHLSLKTAGLLAGLLLALLAVLAFAAGQRGRDLARRFPRSRVAGVVLLTIDLIWTFWLLTTMEMGEFATFRVPLLVVLPIGFGLVLMFVDEFLASRALGILLLLAAEPLLDAAFLRYEPSRLLVTVLAYIMIVAGLIWGTMPYLLRDQVNWSAGHPSRWNAANAAVLAFGLTVLVFALTTY